MTQGKSDTSALDAMVRRQMKRTFDPRVIDGRGGVHGLFRLDYGRERLLRRNYKSPVLVTRAAGVGATGELAARLDSYDAAGREVVARSVNDLIATGAEPLMFVPHVAVREGDAATQTALIRGLADGCVEAGCALLSGDAVEIAAAGETSRAFDLTGFALGVVNENRIVDGSLIRSGDIVLGLSTEGLHGCGEGCVAQLLGDRRFEPDECSKEIDRSRSLGELLLAPSRIYAKPVQRVLRYYRRKIAVVGMAHVTRGIARSLHPLLPAGLTTQIAGDALPMPPLCRWLAERCGLTEEQARRDLNLGIGYILIVRPKYADSIARQLKRTKETVRRLGMIAHE